MSRYFEDAWPHRPKPPKWDDLDWLAKRARVLYPNLAEPSIQSDMKAISAGEGKVDPLTAKQRADQARSGASRVNYQRRWR
jgi:hypothetical protein